MARSIKKTVKVTRVNVFKADFDTMTIQQVGAFEVVGGLGERLCKSRAVREFGEGVSVKCETFHAVYRMDFDTFIANATLCEDEGEDEAEDEDEDED